MLAFGLRAVAEQVGAQRGGQQGLTILVALADAHGDGVAREVDVLDAQLHGLEQTQAGAVEQTGDEAGGALHDGEQGGDLAAVEHDGEVFAGTGAHELVEPWQVDVQDFAVEEQDRGEGLVLRGRGAAFGDGEVGQERGDVLGAELARVAQVVEADEAAEPMLVRFFGARAVAARAQLRAEAIGQAEFGHALLVHGSGAAVAKWGEICGS